MTHERYHDRNVLATQRRIEAAGPGAAHPVVYPSGSSVYGVGTDPLRARGELRPAGPYGVSKLAAESLVVADATTHGLPAVSMRYFPPAAVQDIVSGAPTAVGTLIDHLRDLVGTGMAPIEQCDERPGNVPRTEGRILTAREYLDWSPTTDVRTGLTKQVAWHIGLRNRARDLVLAPAVGG